MKIALLSYAYAPSLGGIEAVSLALVYGLRERGHELLVLTMTPGSVGEVAPEVGIVRRPSVTQLLSALRWADAVLQSNVSLTLAWPLVLGLVRRPWVVVNHTPIARPQGRRTWRDHLKLRSFARAQTYAVSRYLEQVTLPGVGIMPNPIDTAIFRCTPDEAPDARPGELIFVGRITRAKGLDVLVEALERLARHGVRPRLTVVGAGDERDAVAALARRLGVEDQIDWRGVLRGQALADAWRTHRVAVVPSRPEPPEALPLVVLEALSCGCAVLASDQGGLPEAVGACGLLVPPADPEALARAISELLGDPLLRAQLAFPREVHLARYNPERVIDAYEAALALASAPPARFSSGASTIQPGPETDC